MTRFVGKNCPRIDGPAKVTGQARYTTDVQLPGTLCCKILRSPHAHARIRSIDTSGASRMPGVKAVITGHDAWGVRHGFVETPRYPADQYVLANDRVRYIGEEVAAVAAVDEETALAAVEAIHVDYEPLPAVFDLFDAMKPDAPEIHPVELSDCPETFRNIGGQCRNLFGDVEGAFRKAFLVRKDRFEGPLRTHCYLEPQATVAHFDASGILNVWTSGMGVFRKRMHLSQTLGIPSHRIRIHKAWVGGAFGGKIDLFSHEFCTAFLSMKTGRPVRYVADREEIFTSFRHSQPLIIDLETAVDKEGYLLGQKARLYNGCGAYRGSGVVFIYLCWGFLILPYRIPALDYCAYSVYTNTPVRSPQRGHGAPKVRLAAESQLDMIAAELGIDPLEIRLKNARRRNDVLPNGDSVKNAGLVECLEAVESTWRFTERYRANSQTPPDARVRRGVGIGVSAYFTGSLIYPNNSSAIVRLNDDGTIHLLTGALDIGQGAETILAQIVAEELGTGLDSIHVTAGDTEVTPVDIGSWISGLTLVTGNAVKKAAAEVREQLLGAASDELGVDRENLFLEDGKVVVKGTEDRFISFAQAIARHVRVHGGDPITGKGSARGLTNAPLGPSLKNAAGNWSDSYAFDVQAAEVEVDKETGEITVLRSLTAHDCGFPINPRLVEGQIDGQVSMAAGQALTEEVVMKNGIAINPSFLDYKLPLVTELVENEYIHVQTETYASDRDFVTKEVGEGLVSGMLAAIANGVANAAGFRAKRVPIDIGGDEK